FSSGRALWHGSTRGSWLCSGVRGSVSPGLPFCGPLRKAVCPMSEPMTNLTEQFSAYSRWRSNTGEAVARLRTWPARNDVGDAQSGLRLQYLLERVQDGKLAVAFVAEFSRAKSELINAIFFGDHGDRILPSSAGRTTMCPTELQWSKGATPELRLLPIRTRARQTPVSEFKRYREE